MSARAIIPGYSHFVDKTGEPLESGYIYIGTYGLDPETSPVSIYWDQALSIAAQQPVRTLAGYPIRSGTPAQVFVDGPYSIKVKTKTLETVYTNDSVMETLIDDVYVQTLQPWTGAKARTQHDVNQDIKCIFDWFTAAQIADARTFAYSLDLSTPIQAALDYMGSTNTGVHFPSGGYGINVPLKLGTACRIYGENALTTVIKMRSLPVTAIPVFTGSTIHTPTLDYHPILYNASGIQWGGISEITLDGNNLNVYGLRLQENFYMDFNRVYITGCNKYAYINIRGQSLQHNHLVLYKNHGGMVMYNCTSVTFHTCGFERTGATYGVQIMTPYSTKSGVAFRDCWFEDDVAPWNTTGPIIEISGRNPILDNCFFSFSATVAAISATGVAKTMTVDGISMVNDAGCIGGRFVVNCSTTCTINYSADSYDNQLAGQFSTVTDANGGNPYTKLVTVGASTYMRTYIDVPIEYRTSSANFFKIDPTTTTITLWGNSNHKIALESGIFKVVSAGPMTVRSTGGDMAFETQELKNFYFSDVTGACNWQEGHLVMGTLHMWVSGGVPYWKNGAPTSGTDGTPF